VVETFKRNALPDIEADLLEAAQKVFIAGHCTGQNPLTQ
jgi:hypothetical protein